MNPRPYDPRARWMPVSEDTLFRAYAPPESDRAYAARLFESVAREIADEDYALAILREWGIASEHDQATAGLKPGDRQQGGARRFEIDLCPPPPAAALSHAADARVEETRPPRHGAGPGVGGGLSRAEAQRA